MHAAALAVDRLNHARRFSFDASVLAALTVVLAGVVWIVAPSALLPLGVLTAIEGFAVVWARYAERDLIQRLAMEPFAEEIPEVRRYTRRLLRQAERDRLAASINSLIDNAKLPGAVCLADRIGMFEEQLRRLAGELQTPAVQFQARSLVMCMRLLTQGAESPLFNSKVSVEQCRALMLRIQFGIVRPAR
jgi:hypothetical protein